MSLPAKRVLVAAALTLFATGASGQGPSIDSFVVSPPGAAGWGQAFTVTAVVSGGTPPYSYHWTQIAGPEVAITGASGEEITGITPTRVGALTARDRTKWQVTGLGAEDVALGFWLEVTDSGAASAVDDVAVTITEQRTTGSNFVGIGSEVQVNGRDQEIPRPWAWTMSVPPGSSAILLEGDTQAPHFVPDEEGDFVLSENGVEVLTVHAGNWAGVGTIDGGTPNFALHQCATCHVAEEAEWGGTGHAVHYSQHVYANYGGDPLSYCVGCHTVGYDPAVGAVNDGYDDVVYGYMDTTTTAPYDCGHDGLCPADPGYLAPDGDGSEGDGDPDLPAEFIDLPNEVKQKTNIQCENCHGPYASGHLDGSTLTPAGHLGWDAQVCGHCHDQPDEWDRSGHAIQTSTAATRQAECVRCHTGDWFVAVQIDGQAEPTQDLTDSGEPIACGACHDPHQATDWDSNPATDEYQLRAYDEVTLPDGTVRSGVGGAAICMMCHSGRETPSSMASQLAAGSSDFGMHNGAQAYMLAGVMGYEYQDSSQYPDSWHSSGVPTPCVTCHMAPTPGGEPRDPGYDPLAPGHLQLGGHTFATATQLSSEVQNVANVCNTAGCHDAAPLASFDRPVWDFDGDGSLEGVQTEVQGLLEELALRLPPYGHRSVSSAMLPGTTTVDERRAAWNYSFAVGDGSLGVHNTKYVTKLLQESIATLPPRTDVETIFVDDFESANLSAWSGSSP